MRTSFSIRIAAPISEVFAFFDDPVGTIRFQEHAAEHFKGSEVIDVLPDGRQTIDVHMQAGPRTWIQTIAQEVRQPPTRLLTRSWTWSKRRENRIGTMETDRRLSPDGEGTRLDVTVTYRIEHPWKNPRAVILSRLVGNGAARLEMEHSFHSMAEHLEGRHRAASLT
jgi:uncharacterized protein YndB with AHSA1/START domain